MERKRETGNGKGRSVQYVQKVPGKEEKKLKN